MLSERRAADLDVWLILAEHSHLPEFKKMAKGIRQDDAAGNRGVVFRVEQWASGSAGQLLEASETDRVLRGQLRFTPAPGALSRVEALRTR
jgi:hypothetical protein